MLPENYVISHKIYENTNDNKNAKKQTFSKSVEKQPILKTKATGNNQSKKTILPKSKSKLKGNTYLTLFSLNL